MSQSISMIINKLSTKRKLKQHTRTHHTTQVDRFFLKRAHQQQADDSTGQITL